MKLQLSVSETVAVPWLSFPQKNSLSLFLNCHRSEMTHLNYICLSEHINEYNSVNLHKYVWIHPILHCFLLSGRMLLVTAVFPLHNTTWGVWLAASGPFTGPGEFPTQRPVTRSFDVFFDLRLNKRLSKQSWGWWFETLSRSLWRHRNEQYRGQGWVVTSYSFLCGVATYASPR